MPSTDYLIDYHLAGFTNKLIDEDSRTFESYGMTSAKMDGLPHVLTFQFTMSGCGLGIVEKHMEKGRMPSMY